MLHNALEGGIHLKTEETRVNSIPRIGRQRSNSTRMIELGTGVVIGTTIAVPIAVFGAPFFGAAAGFAAGSMIVSSIESAAYGQGFVEEVFMQNHGRNGPVVEPIGKNLIEQ